MTVIRLQDDQMRELADLVAARISAGTSAAESHLLNAGELAVRLGVSTRYVYDHADELGAVKIGAGSKPRLRFDLETARSMLDDSRQTPTVAQAPRRRSQRKRQSQAGSILQVRGRQS